jgi:hypothetical protein
MAQREIPFLQASSNLAGPANYDDETQELTVAFVNGSRYLYKGVPKDVADGFGTAKSAGGYLNACIKGKYEYERL